MSKKIIKKAKKLTQKDFYINKIGNTKINKLAQEKINYVGLRFSSLMSLRKLGKQVRQLKKKKYKYKNPMKPL